MSGWRINRREYREICKNGMGYITVDSGATIEVANMEDGKLRKLFRPSNKTRTSFKKGTASRFRLDLIWSPILLNKLQFYYWLIYSLIRIVVCFQLFYYFKLRIYFSYSKNRFTINIENPEKVEIYVCQIIIFADLLQILIRELYHENILSFGMLFFS